MWPSLQFKWTQASTVQRSNPILMTTIGQDAMFHHYGVTDKVLSHNSKIFVFMHYTMHVRPPLSVECLCAYPQFHLRESSSRQLHLATYHYCTYYWWFLRRSLDRWLLVRDKSARNCPGLRHSQEIRKATPWRAVTSTSSAKKAKLAKQGTASTAVKGKNKQPSKTKRKENNLPPPLPKPRKENDKFVMEIGSQPPWSLSLQQTTNLSVKASSWSQHR